MQIIKEYLRITGISQGELARRAQIDRSNLNNLLKGNRNAGLLILKRLSKATGISIERLVNGIPDD